MCRWCFDVNQKKNWGRTPVSGCTPPVAMERLDQPFLVVAARTVDDAPEPLLFTARMATEY